MENEVSVFPASFAQQRLWFLDELEPGSPTYNIAAALRLRGALDVAALKRSLNEIVRRHEALRTTFSVGDGQAVQVTPGSAAPDVSVTVPWMSPVVWANAKPPVAAPTIAIASNGTKNLLNRLISLLLCYFRRRNELSSPGSLAKGANRRTGPPDRRSTRWGLEQ